MIISKLDILDQYTFFHTATDTFRDEILAHTALTELEPNSYFYESGVRCSHVALIGSGSVRVFVVGASGREVTLYHVQPGESCPVNLLSALHNMNTPANAMAEEPIDAALIPASIFKQWLTDQPVVQQFVMNALASRWVSILSLVEEIKFRKMDQRLAEFLLCEFKRSASEPPIVKFTHEKIAVELGSAREVVSRLLRDFERKGVIELARGQIAQKDEAALQQITIN